MFKRRTLFVLGAGASHEARLPCGAELALKISGKLDIRINEMNEQIGTGDINLFRSLTNRYPQEEHAYQRAAWLIRDGIHLSNSIDDFLDLHSDNSHVVQIGKATIAKCILESERQSLLYFDDSNSNGTIDFRGLHATWFAKFMKTLGKNVPRERAHTIFENVSFIVFNYDRCLEFFLHHAVQRLYGINHKQAAEICAEASIIHPYGVVAPLRLQSGNGTLFGEATHNCLDLAANIRTYTEQVAAGDVLTEIRNEVERAQCIIFLGCAFHEPNMRMLRPAKPVKPVPVFSTAFGISDEDSDSITALIASLFDGHESRIIRLRNKMKCADLFDNFSTFLAG